MVSIQSPLKNKHVGIVGFNARPIACSAKKAGATVYVSDYWGDDDLASCCDDWIAILTPTPGSRQRQPLDLPLYEGLVENLLHLTRDQEMDYVIVGSGFDDHSRALQSLARKNLTGCSPSLMRKARDFKLLTKISKSLEVKIPRRLVTNTPEDAVEQSAAIKFPCLVRPTHSGGGSGIRLVTCPQDVFRVFGEPEDGEYEQRYVQEYISGTDISCSVLAAGNQACTVSVQGQLIGMPSAGRNCDFAYCGNYYPSGRSAQITNQISEVSEAICTKLELKGSVGFDFVIDKLDRLWLMEINPRIQGTLELLETAGKISLTSLHVLASEGTLPETIPKFKPGVKMIVYSRKDGVVPDLSQYPNTVDRTPPGVKVNMRDPICTVIEIGTSMKECYRKVSETTLAIQRGVA